MTATDPLTIAPPPITFTWLHGRWVLRSRGLLTPGAVVPVTTRRGAVERLTVGTRVAAKGYLYRAVEIECRVEAVKAAKAAKEAVKAAKAAKEAAKASKEAAKAAKENGK